MMTPLQVVYLMTSVLMNYKIPPFLNLYHLQMQKVMNRKYERLKGKFVCKNFIVLFHWGPTFVAQHMSLSSLGE